MTETTQTTDAETDHVLAERLKIIRLKQAGIDEASKIVYDLKERLKEAKDVREGRVLDLGDFIRDGSLPLFPDPENPKSPRDQGSEIRNPKSDESWRTIHLSELTDPIIKPAVLAKLANAGIETIGEMADKTASDKFDLTDVQGIGDKAAEDIHAALEAFWARWKDQQAQRAYKANIRDIPASAIKLPKGKTLFDYYCAPELAAATVENPAEVRAFEYGNVFYTITASDGTDKSAKTAEAYQLVPEGDYPGLPADFPYRKWEGMVVIVNDERRVMTGEVRIVLEDRDQGLGTRE